VIPDENGTAFDILIGTYQNQTALLASDISVDKYFITLPDKSIKLDKSQVIFGPDGVPTGAQNFANASDGAKAADEAKSTTFYYDGNFFIQVENLNTGIVVKQNLSYDKATDTFKNLTNGTIYKDNGRGNYANPANAEDFLEPGWRAPVWFSNFSKLFTDQRVRDPLWSVTIWTFAFATITVLTQFAFGLLLAIALNRKIFGRRIYRSILILPYAMPSIMSILIWGGMFDTEFGAINALFHTHIAWFLDVNFARFAVILVNLWLGFPYFYLVSSGALQAIPSELTEAAQIDGANPRQIFSKVTLPLLLQILSPLLISSFAFNFNNFNLIYLLTGGGPRDTLGGEIAGATDILISYTYQIAFGSNVQDLGLASAISFVIFIIVASVSLYGLKRSKVMENFL
jgi:arabinogalactan oligomer/maltooligosaccharide transport system permease protein